MQQYGISNTLSVKIYQTYGMNVYGIMRENPYRLAEDINGVGFRTADEIAAKIGIHTDSDFRIRSGIVYVLMQSTQEGHCYLPMEELLERSAALLGLNKELLETQLSNLMMEKKIVIKDKCVYATAYYYAELNCAKMLHDLNISVEGTGGMPSSKEKQIEEKVRKIETELEIELDELQRRAVSESVKNGLLLLSGGLERAKRPRSIPLSGILKKKGWISCLRRPQAARRRE